MKKKMYTKQIVAVLATTILLSTGCGNADDSSTIDNSNQIETTTQANDTSNTSDVLNEKESTSAEVTTDATEDTTENTDTSPDVDIMTTKGFIPLSQAIESYVFEKEDSMFIYADSTYRGEYRLCCEAKDIIVIKFDYDMSEGYVEVNGEKESFYATAISNVAIVDIDKTDSYKEIALYDEGPSDDPAIILFRYCDGELYNLGEFYGRYDHDYVLFDHEGKILSADGYIDFLDTKIVAKYYEVKGNKSVSVSADTSGALNKSYRVSKDMSVAFSTSKDHVDLENIITIKAGEKIVLLEAYEGLVEFYVELPDGTKGYITTQLAG